MKPLPLALLTLLAFHVPLHSAPAPSPLAEAARKAPQDFFPGYLVRIYNLDKEKGLTNVLAVVQSGRELKQTFMPAAEDQLRGKVENMALGALAEAYIVLEKDTELSFTVEGGELFVNRKDFGHGTFKKAMPKGKYPIELSSNGQGNFEITDSLGQSVVFYPGQMLTTALGRSYRVDKKTEKTLLLNDTVTAPVVAATPAPTPLPAGTIALPAGDAKLDGQVTYSSDSKLIGSWNGLGSSASWTLSGLAPGTYDVQISYALKGSLAGRQLTLSTGTEKKAVTDIAPTGDWHRFVMRDLGPIHWTAQNTILSIIADAIPPRQSFLNLRQVILTKIDTP